MTKGFDKQHTVAHACLKVVSIAHAQSRCVDIPSDVGKFPTGKLLNRRDVVGSLWF